MSRLLIITRPEVVTGFQLSGVEAYGVKDVESAEELISSWLDAGETGLLAIDNDVFLRMDAGLVRRLQAAENLFYLAIPSGTSSEQVTSRQDYLTEMIRQAIGFHITFKGEESEVEGR